MRLTLNSDILAELDLPPSGISSWESRIKEFPSSIIVVLGDLPQTLDPNTSERVVMYYSAQVGLRKLLNDVRASLYKSTDRRKSPACG